MGDVCDGRSTAKLVIRVSEKKTKPTFQYISVEDIYLFEKYTYTYAIKLLNCLLKYLIIHASSWFFV